jgi:hypothetical protein
MERIPDGDSSSEDEYDDHFNTVVVEKIDLEATLLPNMI